MPVIRACDTGIALFLHREEYLFVSGLDKKPVHCTIQNGKGFASSLSFGLVTSLLFPSHLPLHTYTLQLAATQNIKWNINWGLGARWRLHINNFRGKQRERQPMLPSPLQRFLSKQLLEKAACTFCGNAHTACYLMYAFPSLLIHCNTAGLNATVQRLFSFPGKKIHTEGWQCCKCHSPETKHCYFEMKWLIVSNTTCSCIKCALRTGSSQTSAIYGLTAQSEISWFQEYT